MKEKTKFFTPADIIYKIGSIIVLAFFAVMFISLVFFNNSADYLAGAPRRVLQFIIALAALFGLYLLMLLARKFFIKIKFKFGTTLFVACFLMYLCQYYIALRASAEFGWDPGNIVTISVGSLIEPGVYVSYLSAAPNNMFLFYIVRLLIWFFNKIGFSDFWLGLSLFNAFCINLGIFILCITVKKLWGSKTAGMFFILSALLVGLSAFVILPYSDTFCMPFVSAMCLFAVKANEAKTNKKRILFAALFGVMFAFGFLLKAFVLSVAASLFVVYFIGAVIKNTRKKKTAKIFLKRLAAGILASALAFSAIYAGHKIFTDNQKYVTLHKSIEIPLWQYTIATGMSLTYVNDENGLYERYGFFNGDVFEYSAAYEEETTQKKKEYYEDYIKSALKEWGFFGYIQFLFNKARYVTSEGFFGWGENGNCSIKGSPFSDYKDQRIKQIKDAIEMLNNADDKLKEDAGEEEIARRIEELKNILDEYERNYFLHSDYYNNYDLNIFTSFYYPEGKYIGVYLDIVSGVWAVVLLGVVFGCLFPLFPWRRHVKKGFNAELFLRLIPFMVLFIMLFTEAHGRYVFGYVPVFCAASAHGWMSFIKFVKTRLPAPVTVSLPDPEPLPESEPEEEDPLV